MPQNTVQKLRIKNGMRLLTLGAPSSFSAALGQLPDGVLLTTKEAKPDQIHWFVKTKAEVEKNLHAVLPMLNEQCLCWIYFPKGTSGIQTDLSRDKGWESLEAEGLQWAGLVSLDETWSAFGVRRQLTTVGRQTKKPERPGLGFIDYTARTVTLPEDIEIAFRNAKQERTRYEALPFTHKREYLEWVLGAKKAETRARRIFQMIERLAGTTETQ